MKKSNSNIPNRNFQKVLDFYLGENKQQFNVQP